jgi:putative copper export protein
MTLKTLIVGILIVILISLGSGLFFLIRDKGRSTRTAKALTVRIILSLGLIILLLVAYATGLVAPHGALPPAP